MLGHYICCRGSICLQSADNNRNCTSQKADGVNVIKENTPAAFVSKLAWWIWRWHQAGVCWNKALSTTLAIRCYNVLLFSRADGSFITGTALGRRTTRYSW